MHGNAGVIELLNEVLTAELTAVNQYFIHAKMCDNWGYERLGKHNRDESIGEMKDADKLIERILYLEGVPNLQRLGTVMVGETVPEQINLDLQNEREAIDRLNRGISLCVEVGDNGSRDLLEDILEGEEAHADWLETQLSLLADVGEAHYLSQQMHESEELRRTARRRSRPLLSGRSDNRGAAANCTPAQPASPERQIRQ